MRELKDNSVEAPGRDRGHPRRIQLGAMLASFLTVVLVGLAAYGPTDDVEAAPGAATYTFWDLSIEYPYEDPWTSTPDTARASVSYNTRWTTSDYPGVTDCQFILEDASGHVVGTQRFELSSATRELPHAVSSQPITVSGPPASVEASCDEGSYSDGDGYRFSRPTVGRGERGGTRVTFDVSWDGDVHPAMRSCTVQVRYTDGSTRELGPFGFYLSDSKPLEFDLPGADDPSRIRDANIDCSEI